MSDQHETTTITSTGATYVSCAGCGMVRFPHQCPDTIPGEVLVPAAVKITQVKIGDKVIDIDPPVEIDPEDQLTLDKILDEREQRPSPSS